MRWEFPIFNQWKHGDTRTRRGFLWLPRKDLNTELWRWLEYASWVEQRYEVDLYSEDYKGWEVLYWTDLNRPLPT